MYPVRRGDVSRLIDNSSMKPNAVARKYIVRGRVQGVGFRYFVQKTANTLGVEGYASNLDDGNVEVYAIGSADQLARLAGALWKGPAFADVRGVDEQEASLQQVHGFQIK